MISSSRNAKLKLVRALLGRPKARSQAGALVVEGVRLVEEAAQANWPLQFLLYSASLSERGKQMLEKQRAKGVETEEVSTALLQSLSETESSQGILAVVTRTELPVPAPLDFALILDQIRDPGNLGTLLRTAEAAGVQVVLLAPGSADACAQKVMRAGMGAHFRLPVREMTWEAIGQLSRSAGLQVYLAEMTGRPCWETDLRAPLALIIGGEAQGASAAARELAQRTLSIPMPGNSESLNAAVAGSLLIFEIVRQRWKTPL